MKKNFFLFLTIFISYSFHNIKTMQSNSDNIEKVIQGILDLALDNSKQRATIDNFYTFRRLFNLNIQAVAKAYESLPDNLFKKSLNKYLKERIQLQIVNGQIDNWLKQFEIGKFRQKIIEETIKFLIDAISINTEKESIKKLHDLIKCYQKDSIVRTITNVFYYKLNKSKFLTNEYSSNCFINCKSENILNYSQKFSPKTDLPNYLLEHLLEVATYIYEQPINILDLSSNELENLPKTIGCLSDLEKIYLEGNKLKSLPQNILLLTKLKKIKIDKELFAQLPSEFKDSLNAKKIKLKFESN